MHGVERGVSVMSYVVVSIGMRVRCKEMDGEEDGQGGGVGLCEKGSSSPAAPCALCPFSRGFSLHVERAKLPISDKPSQNFTLRSPHLSHFLFPTSSDNVDQSKMSSKNKLTKFKNAVAASSSPTSSPPPPSSKPSTPALTTSQANTLQALHQEHLARLASTTLPNLSASHSRRFLHLARSQTHAADAMWSSAKLQAVSYRKALWADDVDPQPETETAGAGKVVPEFYHKHNPRCRRCGLPFVAGLNLISLRKDNKKPSKKRTSSCTLCRHKFRT